jgi:hypothetical protein
MTTPSTEQSSLEFDFFRQALTGRRAVITAAFVFLAATVVLMLFGALPIIAGLILALVAVGAGAVLSNEGWVGQKPLLENAAKIRPISPPPRPKRRLNVCLIR